MSPWVPRRMHGMSVCVHQYRQRVDQYIWISLDSVCFVRKHLVPSAHVCNWKVRVTFDLMGVFFYMHNDLNAGSSWVSAVIYLVKWITRCKHSKIQYALSHVYIYFPSRHHDRMNPSVSFLLQNLNESIFIFIYISINIYPSNFKWQLHLYSAFSSHLDHLKHFTLQITCTHQHQRWRISI